MLAALSLAAIGVILLVLFGVFYWLAIFATIRAIFAFVGMILVGSAGFVGTAMTTIGAWVSHIGADISNWAFGIPVLAVAAIVVGVVFIHDLMPKHSAGKRTGWAGLLLAGMIIAGATGIPALNSVGSAIQSGVSSVRTVAGG